MITKAMIQKQQKKNGVTIFKIDTNGEFSKLF